MQVSVYYLMLITLFSFKLLFGISLCFWETSPLELWSLCNRSCLCFIFICGLSLLKTRWTSTIFNCSESVAVLCQQYLCTVETRTKSLLWLRLVMFHVGKREPVPPQFPKKRVVMPDWMRLSCTVVSSDWLKVRQVLSPQELRGTEISLLFNQRAGHLAEPPSWSGDWKWLACSLHMHVRTHTHKESTKRGSERSSLCAANLKQKKRPLILCLFTCHHSVCSQKNPLLSFSLQLIDGVFPDWTSAY